MWHKSCFLHLNWSIYNSALEDEMNNSSNKNNVGNSNNNNNSNDSNNNNNYSNSMAQDVSEEQLDLCYFMLKECEWNLPFLFESEEDEENDINGISAPHHKQSTTYLKGPYNENENVLCTSVEENQNTGSALASAKLNGDVAPTCSPFPVANLNFTPAFISRLNNNNNIVTEGLSNSANVQTDLDCNDADKLGISFNDAHLRGVSSNVGDGTKTVTNLNFVGDNEQSSENNYNNNDGSNRSSSVNNNCSNLMKAAVKAYKSRQLTPILKEELKFLIQSRRVSEGKEEMEVHFQPPSPSKLNAREVERIERRRAQNRVAAKRCRQKKKTLEDSLLQKIKELKEFNSHLVQKLQVLRGEKQQLLEVLVQHSLVCPCFADTHLQHMLDGSSNGP